MDLYDIISILGRTVYILEYDVEDNGNRKFKYTEWTVTEIRFIKDPEYTGTSPIFIYHKTYDECGECYEYFGIDDIFKKIFFNEIDAKEAIEELEATKKGN